jgi:hypothetical protein
MAAAEELAVRNGVFVSYSHADREWMVRFTVMLTPWLRDRGVEVWADEHIPVGDDWHRAIGDAAARARTALLLVSPDFLASRFIVEDELPALIEHGARLVPVLLRDCLWQEEARLARLQWAHDPGRDGAIATVPKRKRDGHIVRVCRRLVEAHHTLGPAAAPASAGGGEAQAPQPDRDRGAALARADRPGRLVGVPPPPPAYVAWEELLPLREAVLGAGSGAVGVTGDVAALGLAGQGGLGKSVLAAALARDLHEDGYFPDGVFWVTVGEQGDLVAGQLDLLARLGATPAAPVRTVEDGLRALREALVGRRHRRRSEHAGHRPAPQGAGVARATHRRRRRRGCARAGRAREDVAVGVPRRVSENSSACRPEVAGSDTGAGTPGTATAGQRWGPRRSAGTPAASSPGRRSGAAGRTPSRTRRAGRPARRAGRCARGAPGPGAAAGG